MSEVFPSIPPSIILDDLRITNSVEMTIDNIVEGRLTVTPVSSHFYPFMLSRGIEEYSLIIVLNYVKC